MTKIKLKSQPRIPGITRIPKSGSFHPEVEKCIRNIAAAEGRRFSYVIVEIVSEFFGVDCRTGEILDYRKFKRGH